jgi:uncharacterized protein YdeI (YjbR/CyaY-like superfamily)
MAGIDDVPELVVADGKAWRRWLDRHGQESAGVWLVLAKKNSSAATSLTQVEALDEALCYGWIDGLRRARDDVSFRQRFTPRTRRSAWSKRNAALAERLIDAGRMHPSGLAEVQRAKDDGRWAAAYAGARSITVPDDLAAAFRAEPRAAAMFEILTGQNRYAVLYRIDSAKRADTRARRIDQFVKMLAEGNTIYPQRRTLAD